MQLLLFSTFILIVIINFFVIKKSVKMLKEKVGWNGHIACYENSYINIANYIPR